MDNESRLLRLPDVVRLVGLKRSTVYKKIAAGIFPKSVLLGGRSVAWRSDEIRLWINARPILDRSEKLSKISKSNNF